jgi:hypothetical protein
MVPPRRRRRSRTVSGIHAALRERHVVYEPDAGYTGEDSIKIDAILASGNESKRHYAIAVR